jgi:cellulose synthase operon protein C
MNRTKFHNRSMRQKSVRQRLQGLALSLMLGLAGSPLLVLLHQPSAIAQASELQAAKQLIDQGLVGQAMDILLPLARQYPQSADVQLTLATAYQKNGQLDQAYNSYRAVLQRDPNNRLALLSIGVLGGYKYEWRKAGIEALTTLITAEPDNMAARAQRALLNGYLGNLGEAIADYELVLPKNPSAETVLAAAETYTYAGDYQKSLTLFNQYKTTGKPIRGYAALAYATTLRETGDLPGSVRILEGEVAQTPGLTGVTIRARAALAVSYAAEDQLDRAKSILEPLTGRFDSRMIRARSLQQSNNYENSPNLQEEVVGLYRQVLNEPRDNPYLTVAIAREIADVLSGIPSEQVYAREVYKQLLQQVPEDKAVQISLAVLERQMGLLPKAELKTKLEATLATLPEDAYQKRVLAQSLVRLDSPDPELMPLYQKFLDAQVNEPLLYFRIAQMQLQLNDIAGAQQSLEAYSATTVGSRDQGGRLLLLAEIDRRQGNLEASATKLEQIIAAPRMDRGILSGALQTLASIRRVQGRLPEAVALYDQIIERNPEDLSKPLGRAALAYQAKLITRRQAEQVLSQWLSTRPATDMPIELLSLVAALPANEGRAELYDRLVNANPRYMPLQLRRLQLVARTDEKSAREQLQALIDADPDNLGTYFVQGQLGEDIGDLDLASDAYERVLEASAQNTDAMAALAGIRFQQKDYQSASRLYSQILEREPDNRVAQSALADLTAAQGNRLEGIEDLESLQERQQDRQGKPDPELERQIRRLEEGFLQQRGFQPPWERY